MGVSNPAMSSTIAHAVDEADLGVAGAAQQMIVQVGVTFGIQLLQTVQQVREPAVGLERSYSQAYLAAAVLAGVCVVVAAGVRRAAVTSGPRAPRAEEADVVEAELEGVPMPRQRAADHPRPGLNDQPSGASVMAWMRAAISACTGSMAPDCMAMSLVMSPVTVIWPDMNACIPACGLPSTRIDWATP